MKTNDPDISAEYVRTIFDYDPNTGIFTKKNRKHSYHNGKASGIKHHTGYIYLKIDGKMVYAHRVAWLYMIGNFPARVIDHINGIKYDNRFFNLREVDIRTNTNNQEIHRKGKVPGVFTRMTTTGIYRHETFITFNKQRYCLGTFSSLEEASAMYAKAVELGEVFAIEVNNSLKPKLPKYIFMSDNGLAFRVRVTINNKRVNVGTYPTVEDAVKARDIWMSKNGSI